MKLLLICLLSFLLLPFNFEKKDEKDNFLETNPASAAYQEFKADCKNCYEKFYEVKFVTNNDYSFSLVFGEYHGDNYFDFFLAPTEPNTYRIRVIMDGVEYGIKETTEDGKIIGHFIKAGRESTTVYVYNGANKKEVALPKNFSEVDNSLITLGNGNGSSTTFLEPIEGLNKTMLTLIVTMVFVICMCCVILALLFVFKVGRFSKRAKEAVFDNVNNDYKEEPNNEYSDYTIDYSNYENNETKANDTSVDFEPVRKDISVLLVEKGYKTDYSEMTEEEKNEVMVYFMILKNNNEISSEQYQEEVVKLWKE